MCQSTTNSTRCEGDISRSKSSSPFRIWVDSLSGLSAGLKNQSVLVRLQLFPPERVPLRSCTTTENPLANRNGTQGWGCIHGVSSAIGRALECESRCCGFEPHLSPHITKRNRRLTLDRQNYGYRSEYR